MLSFVCLFVCTQWSGRFASLWVGAAGAAALFRRFGHVVFPAPRTPGRAAAECVERAPCGGVR